MTSRREFVVGSLAAFAPARGAAIQPKERVNLVLQGKSPDRPPFTFWHHFHDTDQPALKHASSTLDFQRRYHLDLVKVMSDYPYPKGSGKEWYELKETASPFPEQIKALELIRDGLAGQKHFLETIFNPFNVATKLSSKEEVLKLMRARPQALLDALTAIAKSEASHAKAAIDAGASGIFLAIDNAIEGYLTREEYKKFSEPFDRMVVSAAKDAPMNTLHLHGDKVYLDLFWKGWPAQIINYGIPGNSVSFAEARKQFSGVLMGGLDHDKVVGAPDSDVTEARKSASAAAPKWICAPGCSVPDDSSNANLTKLSSLLRSAS